MSHFHNCESYENLPHENNWEDIKGNCIEKLYEIASIEKEEMKTESGSLRNLRLAILKAPGLQATVEQCKAVFNCHCISGIKLID